MLGGVEGEAQSDMVTYVVERWRDSAGRLVARHHAGEVEVDVIADTDDELEQRTNEAIGMAYHVTTGFKIRWVDTADPYLPADPSPPGETDNPIN
jgi:hypothetical protein